MAVKFKTILDSPCGIRYIFSKLEMQSSFSRTLLMETRMSTSATEIEEMYDKLRVFNQFFGQSTANSQLLNRLRIKLSHLKDIRTTLTRLVNGDSLDDIEFFEIKCLAIISEEIKELLSEIGLEIVKLPDLSGAIDILDPEKQRILSFYVYDVYDQELAQLRKISRADSGYSQEHQYRAATIEARIRARLATRLGAFAENLEQALFMLGETDILLAKTQQIEQMGLSLPRISSVGNHFKGLFNPEVRAILNQKGEEYQNVDIEFHPTEPLLITGANMGGKTITLKTLALSQYLFQFGFGIPAAEADIMPVEQVYFSIGDGQNLQKGLSSFAAEMLRINDIIAAVKQGRFVLSLIDEPASATNPLEGTALVVSLIKILQQYRALTVVTTHYNIRGEGCRKVRVRGFENDAMNYSLITDTGVEAPRESLKIARSIGVDSQWIDIAEKELKIDRE